MDEVSVGDARIRLFETPKVPKPQPDARVLVDSETAGPANINLPDLLKSQVELTPISDALAGDNARLPVYEGGLLSMRPAAQATGLGKNYYLGPFPVAPTTAGGGVPLIPGNTYFNTSDKNTYVWNGQSWQIQGLPQPATLRSYIFYCTTPSAVFPPVGYDGKDDLGEPVVFDPSHGDTIAVYVNGVKQTQADYYIAGNEDGVTINLYQEACTNAVVELVIFEAHQVNNYVAPVSVNTDIWVMDGVQTTFPLQDYGGQPLYPASANDCLIWYGYFTSDAIPVGRMLNPAKDYAILGAQVRFDFAPSRAFYGDAEASIWMQVGVPLIQPVVTNALTAGLASSGETLELEAAAGVPLLASGTSPAYGVTATPDPIPQLTPIGDLPDPDEDERGKFYLLSKPGFGDSLYLCMKSADDTYHWRQVLYAS